MFDISGVRLWRHRECCHPKPICQANKLITDRKCVVSINVYLVYWAWELRYTDRETEDINFTALTAATAHGRLVIAFTIAITRRPWTASHSRMSEIMHQRPAGRHCGGLRLDTVRRSGNCSPHCVTVMLSLLLHRYVFPMCCFSCLSFKLHVIASKFD